MYNNPTLDITYKSYRTAKIEKNSIKGSILVKLHPHMLHHLIDESVALPCKVRRFVFPYEKNKLKFDFLIHQKISKRSGDGMFLGGGTLSGFPPTKSGEPPIGFTISIDPEGKIALEADLANDIILLENGNFRELYFFIKHNESGREYRFKSFDEMSPEMKRIYHEQFERWMCDLDSDSNGEGFKEFAQRAARFPYKIRFIANGKEYDHARDIPDEEKRRKAEDYEDRIYNPEKYFKYKRFELHCPECGELILPKSSFFGGYKCPICKYNIPTDLIRGILL